jgi:RNA polymerase sigma factor (sigma-70 family)
MATFNYDRDRGRFRNWLRRMVNNKVAALPRARREKSADSSETRGLPDPRPAPDELWDRQWRYHHIKHCIERMKEAVSERNYRAFCLLLFDGCSVAEVCARLGMNANQVYVAKSRVLQHIRQNLGELGFEGE